MSKNNVKAKKIYNVVTTVIVALIFVFLVTMVSVMLIQKKNGGESQVFGYYLFDVLTDSMSGTIEKGEVIVCKKVEDANDLEVGDIITFTAPSGQLKGYNETHRIVNIVYNDDGEIDYIETAGDKLYGGSIKKDDWHLSPDNVKAVFLKKSAFIGGLRTFLSHWYGYVVLIVIPLCTVFALIVIGFVRDKVAIEGENGANSGKITLENISEDDKKKLLDSLAEQHQNDTESDDETPLKEVENGINQQDNQAENYARNDTKAQETDVENGIKVQENKVESVLEKVVETHENSDDNIAKTDEKDCDN